MQVGCDTEACRIAMTRGFLVIELHCSVPQNQILAVKARVGFPESAISQNYRITERRCLEVIRLADLDLRSTSWPS